MILQKKKNVCFHAMCNCTCTGLTQQRTGGGGGGGGGLPPVQSFETIFVVLF